MSLTLTPAELRDLTGSPFRARQIAWLQKNGWLFAVDLSGRAKVARAYYERRMVGTTTAEEPQGTAAPNWAAL